MATITSQIERIIGEAASKAEATIKDAVRRRMAQAPKPGGFLFAMGSAFWIGRDGKSVEHGDISRTEDIDDACNAFLDSFGTMTWRIDYVDGKLVERTDW